MPSFDSTGGATPLGTTASPPHLSPYPAKLPRQLNVTLFPLDITTEHWLRSGTFASGWQLERLGG